MNRLVALLLLLVQPFSLPAQAQDWAAAKPGYSYEFPRDHGAHPDFKIEWWYFTGNVRSAQGERFGYQLTFFRIGAVAQPVSKSPWALRDVWMAHFALSDINGGKYLCADRLNRAGPGLAGASVERVWNEDWKCQMDDEGFNLKAANGDFAIDLELKVQQPPVIHGSGGISQKGSTIGNASHYYSLTRMPSEGTIVSGGETMAVTGESWMDHEFGTSFLEKGQQGWDWFSGQMDDGSALMLFQLRQAPGSASATSPMSAGTLLKPDGTVVPLSAADFRLTPGRSWASPETAAKYPIEWQIEVPGQALSLKCEAAMPEQEFRARATPGLNYWEGAVDYRGSLNGRGVGGQGYLEMTGYGTEAMTRWFGVGD